jgi:hypothetical protein
MGGIAPRSAACFEPVRGFQPGEEGIQQELFGSPCHQAGAKLRQHRVVEPGIGEFQGQGILPVNTTPDGLCRLAIGQLVGILHHGNERQTPRCFSWLAPSWVEGREGCIFIDRP